LSCCEAEMPPLISLVGVAVDLSPMVAATAAPAASALRSTPFYA